MAGLSLRHIYKRYRNKNKFSLIEFIKFKGKPPKKNKEFVAVKDFNMEIEDGEFIVFVGPSGCGKSTTLRMIAGLEEISDGELYIGDTLVNDVDPKSRDIAMVFQSYALYPHMSAYENIAFGLKMKKVPVAKIGENGEPLFAIDNKKIKEISRSIKDIESDLRYVEAEEIKLHFSKYTDALREELKALPKEHTVKAEGIKGEIKALEEAKKRVIAAKRSGDEALINEAREAAQKCGVNVDDIADSETKTGLIHRKERAEKELEYYKTTPVQVYKYVHMTKAEIKEKVDWAAQVLNIEEQLPKKPGEMSGGQRQRIALGRAIVRNPKVFLLDEPLSNLDAKLRAAMRAEIVKLHEKLKTTFIYVTHDQIEAMTMGTRIVVMKLGIVQQIDSPTNLFDYPQNKFVASFIGTPQMNFFGVTIQKDGKMLNTTFENGQTVAYDLSKLRTIEAQYLDGQPHAVTLGIRGENITTVKEGLKTSLTIKEVLGNTTQLFLHLTEDSKDFVVCVSERADFKSGDCVNVAFEEKAIHMFNSRTEESIMSREYGNK